MPSGLLLSLCRFFGESCIYLNSTCLPAYVVTFVTGALIALTRPTLCLKAEASRHESDSCRTPDQQCPDPDGATVGGTIRSGTDRFDSTAADWIRRPSRGRTKPLRGTRGFGCRGRAGRENPPEQRSSGENKPPLSHCTDRADAKKINQQYSSGSECVRVRRRGQSDSYRHTAADHSRGRTAKGSAVECGDFAFAESSGGDLGATKQSVGGA